ncbi:hypothetical protein DEO72_LG7g1690 [Vigna unguiculata]|uniref:Uncharacterized protein n=1 Tax=Vigna unguiculata TaxID=3917 RepID=A0A4D6MG30_VIGUN|nr:hypothetical protein DEO72_LG7g1690 [Vigna unguiculata]
MVDGVRNVSLVAVEVRFYLLPRGVMTVAAVAHAEFKFYGCVRVSEGGGVGCPNWFWIASSRHGGLKSWDSRRWFLIAFAETAPIGLPAVMVASET